MHTFFPLRKIISLLIPLRSFFIMLAIFMLASGQVDLHRGWLFLIVHLTGIFLGAFFIAYFAPNVVGLLDIFRLGKIKVFRHLPPLDISLLFFLIPLFSGLEIRLKGFSELNMTYLEGGVLLYAICFFLGHWALLTDALIDSVKGKKKIVSDGPYEIIRHPKYLAIILSVLSLSFMTGSTLSLIPSITATIFIIGHTRYEDRILRKRSKGYRIYAERIRFRLIPGVW